MLVAGLFLAAACQNTGVSPAREVSIRIGGATAMQPVLDELTTEFRRRYPYVYFDLQGGGSALGEEEAYTGRFNLGASILLPQKEAADPAQQERRIGPIDPNLNRVPIGIDALALIVHPATPVEMLSAEQLSLIFEGRILNWLEVGGPEQEITLVSREGGSGARHIFEERIMGASPVALTAVVMPTSKDVVEYVAQTPGAIGYVSRALVIEHLPDRHTEPHQAAQDASGQAAPSPANVPVRIVGVEGHLPIDAAIQNQLYPLSYPIYLVSRREPTGTLRQFVDFALGPNGQEIVGKYHVRVR